jgi:hypothetical protein
LLHLGIDVETVDDEPTPYSIISLEKLRVIELENKLLLDKKFHCHFHKISPLDNPESRVIPSET